MKAIATLQLKEIFEVSRYSNGYFFASENFILNLNN